ncbi:MAG: recombinase zinc beta ribbon domain-containing protein, partial [Rubrobacteraceae bacterium]
LDQLAKFERAKTSERTRRGRLKKAREGKVVGAAPRAHYGFRFNEARDNYLVDGEEAAVARRIFEMAAEEKMGMRTIAAELTRGGVASPNGKRNKWNEWNATTVRDIIRDDAYKPHSKAEIASLVSLEVAAGLTEASYGIVWYGQRKTSVEQVAEAGPRGKTYRRKQHIRWRQREEWTAIPVPSAGIPLPLVEAARELVRSNRRSSSAGGRVWELSGGLCFCGVCGGRMVPSRQARKKYGEYEEYYRCTVRHKRGKEACSMGKSLRADKLEPLVWSLVSSLLSDEKRLRRGVGEMIRREKRAVRGNPEKEERMWTDKLLAAKNERRGYLKLAAGGRMDEAELDEALALVDSEIHAAGRELSRIGGERARLEEMEEDADALLARFSGLVPDALDCLGHEEKRHVYELLKMRVECFPDGSVEVAGVFGEGLDVRTEETISR